MTRILLSSSVVAICCIVMGTATLAADDAQTIDQIQEQVDKLKSFKYGQDGNVALDLERAVFRLPTDSPLRVDAEQLLIEALRDSNPAGRGIICRQLRVVGTDRCVPAVAMLLPDPELSPFARFALEGIGSDLALDAMHNALDRVPTKLQVGLLKSLARRNYQPMREDAVRLMRSEDAHVAAAAIRALGHLGGTESVAALADLRSSASEQLSKTIDLALLDCASGLVESGETEAAAAIYSKLYEQQGAFQLAGLQGLVETQPNKAADLLVEAMRGDDEQLAAAAIRFAAVSTTAPDATSRFVDVLAELPEARQVLLIRSLGMRGDPVAVPAVVDAARNSSSRIRPAAVDALGGLRGQQAIEALLAATEDRDELVRSVARSSLVRMAGANEYLAQIARGGAQATAVEAINALALRKAKDTTQLMLELATADHTATRAAAIRAIGVLADSHTVDSLVRLAVELESTDDLELVEEALGRVLMRVDDPADRANPLLDALPDAPATAAPVLIRLLARAGTTEALAAVRSTLRSSDPASLESAVAALAQWPSPAAADDLIALIQAAPTPDLQKQALEGYVRIASESDDPSAMLLDVLQKTDRLDAQKRVLNAIGLNCDSFEAIEATQALFGNAQLSAVAAIATVRIAYKLRLQHKERVRGILADLLAKVDHPDVQKRARDVLNDLDKYQDHILQWVAVGPFVDRNINSGETSYKTVFDPEKKDTSELDWEPLTLGIGSWDINLEATYGAKDHCSAYVRTMIWSPLDQDVQIEGGSDDALKIWINGQQVHEQWRAGGCEPRQVLVPARLVAGWNELKLKVTDHEGGWQFGCRVRKPDGTKLDGLKYEAR